MRHKALSCSTLALVVLASTLPVEAATCTLDGGPAATLLLPYFEVDLANDNGRTTLFAVNNASDKAAVAHVVLWTDVAVPTFAFDVYLTGLDVQTVNLRDVFAGRLPRSADAARDPGDVISPQGPLSQDVTFPGCSGLPPQALSAEVVDHLRRAHTGQPSALFGGKCAGLGFDQRTVARGYATIDLVKDCTSLRPGDPGYFGADGVAASDNLLWGDFFYVDPGGSFAQGENLVRIHADPGRFKSGDATFYARLVGASAADGREPLGREWGVRYLTGGTFNGGTDLIVWRDGSWSHQPFDCPDAGFFPPTSGLPQAQRQVTGFDEEEHAVVSSSCQLIDPCPPPPPFNPFPAAATRVSVGSPRLPLPFSFGWLALDLGTVTSNGTDDPLTQAWVGQVSSAQGRFSVGLEATSLDSACQPDRCSQGSDSEVGTMCVLGPLRAGEPARFAFFPKGCFQSGCTRVYQAGCAVERSQSDLQLDALFCLGSLPAPTCLADCSGAGSAGCASGVLEAGSYTAHFGKFNLQFTVPTGIGSSCVSIP
jgi:hypothetical protein